MSIADLKAKIENNTIDLTEPLVWKLTSDSSIIIAEQYLHKICKDRGLTLKYIDSFKDIPDVSFMEDTNLYVIKTDEISNMRVVEHCIVLCKTTKLKTATVIPELTDWQVIDYACSLVSISKAELEWLLTQYNNNYMAFLSDVSKLSCINPKQQTEAYEQMLAEGQFSDHTSLNVWDLTNGIIRRDKKVVAEALKVIDKIDVEPLGLLSILYKGFKNVIDVQLNPKATAESLNLPSKQFYVISKYNCKHYTNEELVKIFKFLTGIEYQFKYEGLDIKDMIDYLIVNIMGV